MDKSSSKKQRNTSKRNYSSSSTSEDDNYQMKLSLKRKKLENFTSKSEEKLTHQAFHHEHDRGEDSFRKIKSGLKGRKFNERKKRKYDSDESCTSSVSGTNVKRKKRKKVNKKEKRKQKKEKRKKDKRKKVEVRKMKEDGGCLQGASEEVALICGPMPQDQTAVEGTKMRRPMVPMTKEEYEKQQSKVRRVFDPETGRNRLVKGGGEIIEEVVSYQKHKEINKLATLGDGASFQKSLGLHK